MIANAPHSTMTTTTHKQQGSYTTQFKSHHRTLQPPNHFPWHIEIDTALTCITCTPLPHSVVSVHTHTCTRFLLLHGIELLPPLLVYSGGLLQTGSHIAGHLLSGILPHSTSQKGENSTASNGFRLRVIASWSS